MIDTQSVSAADIASASATVNTVGKYQGLFIWDTTNHRLMRAENSAAIDKWYVVDGSTSVTPA